jgi:uncharacterized FlaG/YvyC family protein
MNISSIPNIDATAQVSEPASPRPPAADQRDLIQAVKAVNASQLFGIDNEVTILLDRNTHKPVLRIVNKSTHDLVAQIPSETILRMAEEIQ